MKKSHLDVASAERLQRILCAGRWWLPPSSGRGVSCGSKCPWLVPTPKGVPDDALPSPGVNPLEGSPKCSCGKLGLGRCSRLPTLERGRGSSWEPRD